MLLTVYGGVHVRRRIFREGQGFAAFGRKFEGPPPLDVFDTFPNQQENNHGLNKIREVRIELWCIKFWGEILNFFRKEKSLKSL